MHPVFRLQPPKIGAHLPECLSHSALTEIELCPRRWWLLQSQYDGLIGPYPEPVFAATVMGSVVHGALKAFADALRRTGSPAPGSVEFAEVRRVFPLRETVRQLRREALDHLTNNPRVDVATVAAAVSVDGCIAAFKRLVTQAYSGDVIAEPGEDVVANVAAANVSGSEAVASTSVRSGIEPARDAELDSAVWWATDGPLAAGTDRRPYPVAVPCPAVLPEVQVEIADPPLRGTIDLVVTETRGDTVVEFKTGEPRPEHETQLRIYAVLWWRWTSRPIQRRLLVYADHEPVPLSGLGVEELEREVAALRQRIDVVRADVSHYPPPARPAADKCPVCPVRQLCDEYWQAPATIESRWSADSLTGLLDGQTVVAWRDLEIDLRNPQEFGYGFSTQLVPGRRPHEEEPIRLLCNVPQKFHPGALRTQRRVRLLRVGLRRESNVVRVIWSRGSEAFWD